MAAAARRTLQNSAARYNCAARVVVSAVRSRAAALLLGMALLAACGRPAVVSAGDPVTLTEASFGSTVRVVVGQVVIVRMTDSRPVPGSSLVWTVTSSDPAILQAQSAQHDAAAPMRDGAYTARFLARGAGTAKLHAAGATTCEAMQKSGCPDRAGEITVEVS